MKFFIAALAFFAYVYAVPTPIINDEKWRQETDCLDCFEGDIKLDDSQAKNGITDETRRWPNGIVPYVFEDGFNTTKKDMIINIWKDYDNYTNNCVRMVPRTDEANFVRVTNYQDDGCFSYVGMRNSLLDQQINYPDWCIEQYGSVLHEMLHALGFYHEQSTYNRDDYVTINYTNIRDGYENNFNKYDNETVTDFGTEYDYDSVMHYGGYGFSKNGELTIVTKNASDQDRIGQRDGFSPIDVEKLKRMYSCS